MMASGEIRLSGTMMRRMPVLAQSTASPGLYGVAGLSLANSNDEMAGYVATANKTFPVENPGWDAVGLDFLNGIVTTDGRFLGYIRPRHSSNSNIPNKGRFSSAILSGTTTKDQFDAELAALFNKYTPIPSGTDAGLALEFVLPPGAVVGDDYAGVPTNSWTVILAPVGSGVYQLWTTYPGHPTAMYDLP